MRKKLGEVLREAGLIDELQLEAALSHQRSFGGHLGRILIDSGFLSEQQLVETLSRMLGVPRVELARRDVPAELLAYVPLDFAEKFHAVPVALRAEAKGEQLFLAMSDPTNLEAVDTLQFKTGKRVVPMIAAESEVEGAIRRWYYGERPREITPRSLDHVQFPGREVESRPSDLDEIPVITGATLVEPPAAEPPAAALPAADVPAAETPAALSGDWFLQLDAMSPPAAVPPQAAAPPPAAAIAPPATAPTPVRASPSSPFTAAPPAPAAPPTIDQPSSSPFAAAPSSREALFGSPNSFLGRDDETGLGQADPREPRAEEPLALPDDALTPLPDAALTPLPDAALTPLADAAFTPLPDVAVPPMPAPAPPPPQQDPFAPAPPPPGADPFAPSASGALPVATARPDDDDNDAPAPVLKPLAPAGSIEPLTLDDDDDTPIELATAADFLHGGPPLAAAERGLELDDDDDAPIELASAAEMISTAASDGPASTPDAPPVDPDPEGGPMLLATAAELAQMSLGPDAPVAAPEEPPAMPGFADLSELTDLALAPLSHLGAPGLDPDVTADLDVNDAGYSALAEARARALEEAAALAERPLQTPVSPVEEAAGLEPSEPPAPLAAVDVDVDVDVDVEGDADAARLRPLPPPGGVLPDGGDDDGDAPIEVVNMPPDRRPVEFPAVAAAPKPSSVEDDFGNPLDAGAVFDGEMEALDIEGSEFDADSGEVPLAPASVASPSEPTPLAESDDVEITEDIEVDVATPPAPLLSAHAIHEMERLGHDGTTTLSAAGLVDTPERVAGAAAPGEVMTLALPTPAFSHASMVDAPWRLAGAPAPLGRGPGDVPLAPFGLTSSSFALVDDVTSLAPPAVLARLRELGSAAVALPGRATLSASPDALDIAADEGFRLPDTVPVTTQEVDDDPATGLADAWREAAERQLLHRSHSDELVVPERRRALEAPQPTPVVEAPRPLHAYVPAAPASQAAEGPPPWAMLVDAPAAGAEPAPAEEPALADSPDVDVAPHDEPHDEPPPPPDAAPLEELPDLTADATPLPAVDWAAALDDGAAPEPAPAGVSLPSATPRSVLIADVVHMDDDLTPESSPPQAAPSPSPASVPGGVSFAPTPTMITRMSPEELRALAERLVQRGALTADDIDAARKAKEADASLDDEEP